jgi:carbohydrate kinase (thermoresistant glucokinase family)
MALNRFPRIVVMGVSGCGKSTVGQALADHLSLPYVDGDSLHPPHNVALMAAGTALSDEDRQGWLQAIGQVLQRADGSGVVVSCSALKRSYRDLLRSHAPDLRLLHLHGSPELLSQRMRSRAGHYMPVSLLQSQLDTLQWPAADEGAIVVDVSAGPADIVKAALRELDWPRKALEPRA